MHKLALLLVLAAGCGGASTTPDPMSDNDASIDPTSDAGVDGVVDPAAPAPSIRAVVSGAKRLHGANGLVVDVEIGHGLDQGVHTSGPLVVRGGAANLGN